MRVYIELNDLAGVQNIPFWQEKLKDFESLRNSENGTQDLFQSLEDEDMVTLACIGTKIIKDWDRLSFFRLYTRCCQVWNSRHLYDIIDFRLVQSDLNINDKTIEYACKVDLEHIETLFNTRDKEGLTKLLHYSEDCDDSEYQCSYKVKAENKIKRCLDRLSATESVAPAPLTLTDKDTNIKTDTPEDDRSRLIWKVAQDAGYIDDNRQWIDEGHTKRQRAIVAHELGTLLNVNYDKYFSRLWNCRKMSTDYCNALQTDKDRISNLFADALRKAGYFAS